MNPTLMFWLSGLSFILGGAVGIMVSHARAEQIAHRVEEDLKEAKAEILRLRAHVASIIGR